MFFPQALQLRQRQELNKVKLKPDRRRLCSDHEKELALLQERHRQELEKTNNNKQDQTSQCISSSLAKSTAITHSDEAESNSSVLSDSGDQCPPAFYRPSQPLSKSQKRRLKKQQNLEQKTASLDVARGECKRIQKEAMPVSTATTTIISLSAVKHQ